MILNDLKIYCSYTNKKQYNNYNLYNSNILKSYCLTDKNIFEPYLIDNNSKLREFQMMLYVYEHNIKSKYVGFCHYRRHWNYINFNLLKQNHTCCYISCDYNKSLYNRSNILNDIDRKKYAKNYNKIIDLHQFYYSNLDKFVKLYYSHLKDRYTNIVYNSICIIHHSEMFITNWKIFKKILKFIKEYLYFIFGNELSNIENVLKKFKSNRNNSYIGRTLATFLEDLVSICIDLFDDIDYNDNQNNNSVYYTSNIDVFLIYTGKENLEKWIYKQYSLGIKNIIVFNESDKDIEYLNSKKYEYKFLNCSFINKSYKEFNNIQEISDYSNNIIHKYYGMTTYYIIFKNEEYLSSDEIIQYKNELWNGLQISNKKINTVNCE